MTGMMIVQFLVLTAVVSGVLIFILHRVLIASTDGAVHRLERETGEVRAKQAELNQKIKQAKEELERKREEAEALAARMIAEAEESAKAQREQILQKARQDSEEIIRKAQGTKEEIRQAVRQEMELKAVDYTVAVLNMVLSEQARGSLDERLISEFLEKLKNVDMTPVTPDVDTAEFVAARNPRGDLKESLQTLLKQKLGRQITVSVQVDPGIVGGGVLKFGSLNLDGSLQNQIIEAGSALKGKIENEGVEIS